MVFSTLLFLFRFLPITLLLYYIAPGKAKNWVLFIASLIFYSWGEIRYFPMMMALILLNYLCSLGISHWRKHEKLKKLLLIISIIGSLGMLVYFKYVGFIIETINLALGTSFNTIQGIERLPLGISFYTFQTMSYTIDVYRNQVEAEPHFIDFGTYVVMFPQLIAGPIVKYRDISEKLHVYKNRVSLYELEEGITEFILGLSRKVLLADGIGRLWSDIVGTYSGGIQTSAGVGLANATTGLAWLGVLAYSMQLYFDFSGYSLMSIGIGKMLGFTFPQNFNNPYMSRSITEFWRRWHMTLSGWFKEYVYIPLGGNRKGALRTSLNLFVVWTLTGVWHGASWNFVLWGIYYFILLAIEKAFLLRKLEKGVFWPHVYTLFLVVVGWALFVSSESGVGLGLLLGKLFVFQGGISAWYLLRNYGVLLSIGMLCCTSLPMKVWQLVEQKEWLKNSILMGLLFLCVCYIVGASNSPFLYFNF